MKMKQCTIEICRHFSDSHFHVLRIVFDMIDGTHAQWDSPSREVVEMMLYHSKTKVIYLPCNRT